MNSPGRFKNGFTLIEMLIAIAVSVVTVGSGLYLGADQYRGYALRTDKDILVSMLEKTRARAMNNIDQSAHGLSVQPSNYVIFEGASYATRNVAADENIPRSYLTTETGLQEVVFSQLSGEVLIPGDLTISNERGSQTININNEGRISW